MNTKLLFSSAAALALFAFTAPAHAEGKTVTTTTTIHENVEVVADPAVKTTLTHEHVETKDRTGVTEINFKVFDVNGDGFYSMDEVGERLFEAFDRDQNSYIDNIEWNTKSVLTIMPMEKETFKFVDTDSDGHAEKSTYTYETFYQASGLALFDKNMDGLTPKEFIDTGYEVLDNDENKLISLEEWKEAYLTTRAKHEKQDHYNQQ